jgi:hypothetical protein
MKADSWVRSLYSFGFFTAGCMALALSLEVGDFRSVQRGKGNRGLD